jgi:hypothetical protein
MTNYTDEDYRKLAKSIINVCRSDADYNMRITCIAEILQSRDLVAYQQAMIDTMKEQKG